jgi:F0F1-type ATP synthase membrane subunit c/vacuolar-type H+-ATPase subunit K
LGSALGFIAFSVFVIPVHAFGSVDFSTQFFRSLALAADPTKVLGAGIAFGLAALGAGVAVGYAGSAAIAAIAEKPNLFGRALVIVVLGEGIAIYGFVIVFILTSL